jgi:hypothetical protein
MNNPIKTCGMPSEYDIKNVVLKFQELIFGLNNV